MLSDFNLPISADTLEHIAIFSTSVFVLWVLTNLFGNKQELELLRQQVQLLLTELGKAQAQITSLTEDLATTRTALAAAEDELRGLRRQLNSSSHRNDENELLVIDGASSFFQTDLMAIRSAGWNGRFRRLEKASVQKIREELARRRLAGTTPKILHLSGHAGPEGFGVYNELLTPQFLSENLSDIEGVFLAGCSDVRAGDALDGVVCWHISMREGLNNDDAAAFTRAFYERLGHGVPARQAYLDACNIVPSMREMVDFRERSHE